MIAGDMRDALDALLAPDGMDFGKLNAEEVSSHDHSRLSYTEHDRKVLRQFEGAAMPAKRFCKFLQDKRNAWAYMTFEARIAIQDTAAPFIPIHDDISRFDGTRDLRQRGHKSVLVKKSRTAVSQSDAQKYSRVEVMDSCVEKYCKLYTEDLTHRLQLDASNLPPALSRHVILNPIFGPKTRIIGSGLMSDTQHYRGRACEYLLMS